ncbi:MAG: S9 family peptidase, partial [Gemmatimonadales bacterium]
MSNPSRIAAAESAEREASELSPDTAAPPLPRVAPQVHTIHGESRIDEYHWLRHRDDPAVLAHLEAENRYTEVRMRHTAELQERLYREMRGRIRETDLSVPEQIDGWLYYSRMETGHQYPIFCRRAGGSEAEEILLDLNPLAEASAYFRLGGFEVSPDHRLLAWSADTTGAEAFSRRVKDLATGDPLPEVIENTSPALAWAGDSRTLFYIVLDPARRPARLFRHLLGTDPAADPLVHDETDQSFFLDVGQTRSRRYILLDIASHSTSEVRFVPADAPAEPFRVVEPRRAGIEYEVSHHDDRFFITTNDGAVNFRLMEAPVADPSRERWRELLPARPAVKIDSTDAFRNHLVVWEREAGLRQIRVLDLGSGADHLVAFPEPVYTVSQHDNPEFDTTLLRFTYTSMVTPSQVVDYDLAGRTWTVRKQTEVLGGFDPAQYRSERVFATAPDGTRVPVSLVYRRPLELDGSRPLLLQGYGAYGISYDPSFSSNAVSLLDRGVIVAIAHVRGGEEMGRTWYEAGRLLNKRNSFADFIAAAEHLVAAGYTGPRRLAIGGGSAGGLLMGAVINQRPDLFGAVLAEVPFVDVVNTMLDASLPLTVIEYDEWGNPNDPVFYEYIRSYSPYDNVQVGDYPPILVTAGLNDPRVAYWEPAKWVARLRARKTDGNLLLLRTN